MCKHCDHIQSKDFNSCPACGWDERLQRSERDTRYTSDGAIENVI